MGIPFFPFKMTNIGAVPIQGSINKCGAGINLDGVTLEDYQISPYSFPTPWARAFYFEHRLRQEKGEGEEPYGPYSFFLLTILKGLWAGCLTISMSEYFSTQIESTHPYYNKFVDSHVPVVRTAFGSGDSSEPVAAAFPSTIFVPLRLAMSMDGEFTENWKRITERIEKDYREKARKLRLYPGERPYLRFLTTGTPQINFYQPSGDKRWGVFFKLVADIPADRLTIPINEITAAIPSVDDKFTDRDKQNADNLYLPAKISVDNTVQERLNLCQWHQIQNNMAAKGLFLGPDGFVLLSNGDANPITERAFSKDEKDWLDQQKNSLFRCDMETGLLPEYPLGFSLSFVVSQIISPETINDMFTEKIAIIGYKDSGKEGGDAVFPRYPFREEMLPYLINHVSCTGKLNEDGGVTFTVGIGNEYYSKNYTAEQVVDLRQDFPEEAKEMRGFHLMVWPNFRQEDWRDYYLYVTAIVPEDGDNPPPALQELQLIRKVEEFGGWKPEDEEKIRFNSLSAADIKEKAIKVDKSALFRPMSKEADELGYFEVCQSFASVKTTGETASISIDLGTMGSCVGYKIERTGRKNHNVVFFNVSCKLIHGYSNETMSKLSLEEGRLPLYPLIWSKGVAGRSEGTARLDALSTILNLAPIAEGRPLLSTFIPANESVVYHLALRKQKQEANYEIHTNPKWATGNEREIKEAFLRTLLLLAAAELKKEGVSRISRVIATIPLAFGRREINEYRKSLSGAFKFLNGTGEAGQSMQLGIKFPEVKENNEEDENLMLLSENEAAINQSVEAGQKYLYLDLGGGTLDITCLETGNPQPYFVDSIRFAGKLLVAKSAMLRSGLSPSWPFDLQTLIDDRIKLERSEAKVIEFLSGGIDKFREKFQTNQKLGKLEYAYKWFIQLLTGYVGQLLEANGLKFKDMDKIRLLGRGWNLLKRIVFPKGGDFSFSGKQAEMVSSSGENAEMVDDGNGKTILAKQIAARTRLVEQGLECGLKTCLGMTFSMRKGEEVVDRFKWNEVVLEDGGFVVSEEKLAQTYLNLDAFPMGENQKLKLRNILREESTGMANSAHAYITNNVDGDKVVKSFMAYAMNTKIASYFVNKGEEQGTAAVEVTIDPWEEWDPGLHGNVVKEVIEWIRYQGNQGNLWKKGQCEFYPVPSNGNMVLMLIASKNNGKKIKLEESLCTGGSKGLVPFENISIDTGKIFLKGTKRPALLKLKVTVEEYEKWMKKANVSQWHEKVVDIIPGELAFDKEPSHENV